MPVDMIPVGEKPESFSSSSILYVFFAKRKERLSLQPWWITSSRTEETSDCSGMKATGNRSARDAMTRRLEAEDNHFRITFPRTFKIPLPVL